MAMEAVPEGRLNENGKCGGHACDSSGSGGGCGGSGGG